MNWFRRLFSWGKRGEKVAPVGREKSRGVIEIPNSYGNYDSSPLLVEERPDLEAIFKSHDPPVIQKISEQNRDYWATASVAERCMTLFVGYLQHPNPEVRRAVMAFIPRDMPAIVSQVLVDRLGGDTDELVRLAAAKTIWGCERDVNCEYAVSKLKDEIEYGTERSVVGPSRARKALELLIDNAPDQASKEALISKSRGG